jgi:hypothetical protein
MADGRRDPAYDLLEWSGRDNAEPPDLDLNRGAQILRALLSAWLGVHNAFVNVRGGRAVDQETK